jgi:hypothetical protein
VFVSLGAPPHPSGTTKASLSVLGASPHQEGCAPSSGFAPRSFLQAVDLLHPSHPAGPPEHPPLCLGHCPTVVCCQQWIRYTRVTTSHYTGTPWGTPPASLLGTPPYQGGTALSRGRVPVWSTLQCRKVHAKFHPNPSSGSPVELCGQKHGQPYIPLFHAHRAKNV